MQYDYIDIEGELYAVLSKDQFKSNTEKRYNIFLKKSGIPESYWDIQFEDYLGNKESKVFTEILYYAQNCHLPNLDFINLYLYGIPSTQKTTLMCNIGKQAIMNGLKVKMVLAGSLINKLMKLSGYSDNRDGIITKIYNEIEELKKMDMLLIDDFGDNEKALMWRGDSKNLILCLWDEFFREVLATKTRVVITSNNTITSLQHTFGNSLFELLDRNFKFLHLIDSVKDYKKSQITNAFNNLEQSTTRRRGHEQSRT